MGLYGSLVRPLLFRLDPEVTHETTLRAADFVGRLPGWRSGVERRFGTPDPSLRITAAGLDVPSPIGMSGGFDKNGRAIAITSRLGFGFLEIGSVTLNPWRGNEGCRLVRLPDEQGVWSRYGLPNDGAGAVLERLRRYNGSVPLGVNVAAVHAGRPEFDVELATTELVEALRPFVDAVDYAVVNLACPNTQGHDLFSDPAAIDRLLARVAEVAPADLPLMLKFRHRDDLAWTRELLEVVGAHPAIRALTPSAQIMRERQFIGGQTYRGSVTGAPVRQATIAAIRQWHDLTDPAHLAIVAAGGVASGADAYAAIRAGASLVKVFTALVFHGPGLIARINTELAQLLATDGLDHVNDAIGADARKTRVA